MEDIGKAIIMTGHILMFIFATTISIYLYSTLTNSAKEILVAGENSNRGDSIIASRDYSLTREVKPEEILMAILDLKSEYENNDVTVEVKIKNATEIISYTYDGLNEKVVRTPNVGMESTYDFNSMFLRTALYTDLDLPTGNRTYSLQNKGNTLLYVKN